VSTGGANGFGGTPPSERERWASRVTTVLKASCEDADVSRKELARRLGLTADQVASLEYGRCEVRVVDLILIAQALRIDPETLLRRVLHWGAVPVQQQE
jgi:ribosome-binding protein aMBF1 (putative translation factor)